MSSDSGIIPRLTWSYTLKTTKCLEIQNRLNREIRMIWARFLKPFTKTGVAALALAALAAAGNADEAYKGKFTLTAKTQWGDVTLPAGDYTFALPSASSPYRLYIHGKTVSAIVTAVTIDETAVSHGARLDLMEVEAAPAVRKFEAPERLGLIFIYWTPETPGKQGSSANVCPTGRICVASRRKQN